MMELVNLHILRTTAKHSNSNYSKTTHPLNKCILIKVKVRISILSQSTLATITWILIKNKILNTTKPACNGSTDKMEQGPMQIDKEQVVSLQVLLQPATLTIKTSKCKVATTNSEATPHILSFNNQWNKSNSIMGLASLVVMKVSTWNSWCHQIFQVSTLISVSTNSLSFQYSFLLICFFYRQNWGANSFSVCWQLRQRLHQWIRITVNEQ